MSNEIAIITAEELALVSENALNEKQLQFLFKKTPPKFVKSRPARGGGNWDYVSGGYVRKVLNLIFGFNWDFEVISEQVIGREVVVKGKLTCVSQRGTITKMQFGSKEIIYKKGTTDPLSIGNDFKAAATDALKKCASMLGIAADVYDPQEFKEVKIKGIESKEKQYE